VRLYVPSFSGDVRFESVESGSAVEVIVHDPTAAEEAAVTKLLEVGRVQKWTDLTEMPKAKNKRTRKSVFVLRGPISEVGDAFVKLVRPSKSTLTALRFSNGELHVTEGTDGDKTKALIEAGAKDPEARAVSVKRPTMCCPQCVPGAIGPASEVLLDFLSPQQHRDWAKHRVLEVDGGTTGHRYLLAHRHSSHARRWGRVCYDPQTQVLTRSGWVFFDGLLHGVEVATYNSKTNRMEFQVPTDYIRKPYEGLMYRARTNKVSLLVTPDHDIYAGSTSKKNWMFRKAKDVVGIRYAVRRTAAYDGASAEPILLPGRTYSQGNQWQKNIGGTDTRTTEGTLIDVHQLPAWARFLGHYISEGSLHMHEGEKDRTAPAVTIHQRKSNTSKFIETAEACGLNPRVYDKPDGMSEIRVGGAALARYLERFGRGSRGKRIPAYVYEWPLNLRRCVIDGLMDGDGHIKKSSGARTYNTVSEPLADDVQRLIVSMGASASINISEWEDAGGLRESYKGIKRKMFRVNESWDPTAYVNNHEAVDGFEEYKGEVFCVSVPNRVLFTRRDGKIVLCGNCFDADDSDVLHFHDQSHPPEEEVLGAMLMLRHRESWLRNEASCFAGIFRQVLKNPFGDILDGTRDAAATQFFGAGLAVLMIQEGIAPPEVRAMYERELALDLGRVEALVDGTGRPRLYG
jgi:hypothetical protein